jgi:hypothetical protein
MKFRMYFMQLSSDLREIQYTLIAKNTVLSDCECRGNLLSERPTLIVGIHEFIFFRIYYPIWVKFGIRYLNILLLSTCEFCENRDKKGRNRETV